LEGTSQVRAPKETAGELALSSPKGEDTRMAEGAARATPQSAVKHAWEATKLISKENKRGV
jgi:hypothetical protein